LREVQDANGLGMRVELAGKEKTYDTVLFFRRQDIDPDILAKGARIKELLHLPAETDTFRLVYSPVRGEGDALAVVTRSMLQVMQALAHGVDIPAAHQERKLTPPAPAEEKSAGQLLRVRSGPDRPVDAFAAVPYEGSWFWISDDDWVSKRTFTSMMFLFTMLETGQTEQLPVLTIPTQ